MSARPATSTSDPGADADAGQDALAQATVAVLLGGRSSEREVSRITGRAVLAALRTPAAADDRRGPAEVLDIELRPDGRWAHGGRTHSPGRALEVLEEVDVFFLALHGGEGEGGTIQGLLTAADRAFTGSGVGASAVALDKLLTRHLAEAAGLALPRVRTVGRAAWAAERARLLEPLTRWDVPGWVVKPRCGGSSVGTHVLRAPDGLAQALDDALGHEQEALVEELVEGIETTVAVLDEVGARPRALPLVEIRPKPGRFFDYEEKYSESGAQELCPPTSIPAAVGHELQERSIALHALLRCSGYSRSDFIVPTDGGAPRFLELNTLPGLTPRSLVPLAASVAGLDYRSLCLALTADGLRRGPRAREGAGGT